MVYKQFKVCNASLKYKFMGLSFTAKKMMLKTLSILIILLISTSITGQTPFIRNFPPEEYKANTQNWDIVQDQRGVMYFANSSGVLEYDGVSWELINTPPSIRSLCVDSSGLIYAGSYGDFGCLQADSLGNIYYTSLKEKIPYNHLNFKHITQIEALNNKIIFKCYQKIFILQNDSIIVLPTTKEYGKAFVIQNEFYIEIKGEGIYILKDNTLNLLPGNEKFHNKSIWSIIPYSSEEILVAIHNEGFYTYTPNRPPYLQRAKGFKAINEFINTNNLRCGTILPNGHIAIGSLSDGIIVFDRKGEIQKHYHQKNGLQSNTAYYLYTDLNGQLWAALENGISHIMSNLPFSLYTHKDGIFGSIYSIIVFENKLYAGTGNGLYVKSGTHSFEKVKGTTGQNFFLCNAKGRLLLGNIPNGILDIVDNRALSTNALNLPTVIATTLRKNPNYILTQAWDRELAIVECKNKQWVFKNFIKGFKQNARMIEEDNNGYFWVNANEQLYKLRLNNSLDSVIFVQDIDYEQYGLPGKEVLPYRLNGEVVFSTSKGIYRYIPDKDLFEPHPIFNMFPNGVNELVQDASGNIWFEEYKNHIAEKGVLRLVDGKYQSDKTPFLIFKKNPLGNPGTLYPYSDSIVYFGINNGLIEYYPKQVVNYNIPFNTLIRKVFVNDSLLYGGTLNKSHSISNSLATLNHTQNNLLFYYSSTFYEESEENLFSYRLIGSSDTTWSDWTKKTQKEYTNLSHGKYVFEVKSKNIYRKTGSIASFEFVILTPWYSTNCAYLLYLILLITLIWFLNKRNTARLTRKNKQLEALVAKHTQNISKQKEMLQNQAEELAESNKKLKQLNATKDKFFAIISHDLKSPFNSILGLTKLLNEGYDNFDDTQKKEILCSINKSSKLAFKLLKNLLAWAKSQSGRMVIAKELVNLKELVETSITPYKQIASEKNIKITINIPSDAKILIDWNTAITVISNLTNNAIKFTPEGGTVTINYHQKKDNIELHFIDTGVGIDPGIIENLFKIDKITTTKGTNNEEGTGLGLILCKEFVNKNGGEISVISEKGKGSTFIVSLPKQ